MAQHLLFVLKVVWILLQLPTWKKKLLLLQTVYISSAGLRVLLSTHKNFAKKGGMTITNVNETVMDIFDVTGFKDILTIK